MGARGRQGGGDPNGVAARARRRGWGREGTQRHRQGEGDLDEGVAT